MDIRQYEDLKEMLCMELEKIVEKGELSAGSLDSVHKLTDTIKNIGKIEMLEDGEYSEDDGMWRGSLRYGNSLRGHSSYNNNNSYNNNGSYGRMNNSSYARRRRYSRAEGKDMIMERLGEMMSEAEPRERDILKNAMRQMEEM